MQIPVSCIALELRRFQLPLIVTVLLSPLSRSTHLRYFKLINLFLVNGLFSPCFGRVLAVSTSRGVSRVAFQC